MCNFANKILWQSWNNLFTVCNFDNSDNLHWPLHRENSALDPAALQCTGGFSSPPHKSSREFPVWPALTQAHRHNRTLAYLHTLHKLLFKNPQQLIVSPKRLKALSKTKRLKLSLSPSISVFLILTPRRHNLWPVQASNSTLVKAQVLTRLSLFAD